MNAYPLKEMNVCTKQPQTFSGKINDFLTEDHLDTLKNIMKPVSIKAPTHLFWEGDDANELYYIRSGLIKLKKTTSEGKELILSIMGSGHLLGEFGGYGEKKHRYNAELVEDVEIGVVKIKELENLLAQFGNFAIGFMNWLGFINQKEQSKLHDLLLNGKAGALASTLIRMSNSYGVTTEQGILLDIKLTNTDIAEFIGATRESVNRFLNIWREDGILSIRNGQITIKKLNELRCICNCPSYPACPIEICRI
ncbi:Crp/Fnr family transcriptional regulator [Alkalihalobacillus sp. BA299]|uniref:Crp/Fnr family transcriptional regulator n=1 Tax=Alkalihalobacillus sp. BA299 TaxID=2815938 RepID=UPI001ADAB45F|nr:Crp/Fnr family transcriptional regulator [Alkalihalobacillus sp. BA299]